MPGSTDLRGYIIGLRGYIIGLRGYTITSPMALAMPRQFFYHRPNDCQQHHTGETNAQGRCDAG